MCGLLRHEVLLSIARQDPTQQGHAGGDPFDSINEPDITEQRYDEVISAKTAITLGSRSPRLEA